VANNRAILQLYRAKLKRSSPNFRCWLFEAGHELQLQSLIQGPAEQQILIEIFHRLPKDIYTKAVRTR
jgi:hypothetical protein